ncbi:MAG: hypothetical protein C0606_09950 [Hyphomicrobiales bacterium]|nr:MAG: hypothetical protein C0606_09950 [Hyphomicrobiales bacterium]
MKPPMVPREPPVRESLACPAEAAHLDVAKPAATTYKDGLEALAHEAHTTGADMRTEIGRKTNRAGASRNGRMVVWAFSRDCIPAALSC